MSILEAVQTGAPAPVAEVTATAVAVAEAAPYRRGDRINATSPEGERFLVRVEAVTSTPEGDFAVLGAVITPRRFRSHVLSTVVGADGYGPAVQPL